MKNIALALIACLPAIAHAIPCVETAEYKNVIAPEMAKTAEIDKLGAADFEAALKLYKKATGINDQQLLAYTAKITTSPEQMKFQTERQDFALKLLGLINSSDCTELVETNKKMSAVMSIQWISVLAAVQADLQVHAAKSMTGSDELATTVSGKKVLLHPDGTWSPSN
jgi:hypothetical protein